MKISDILSNNELDISEMMENVEMVLDENKIEYICNNEYEIVIPNTSLDVVQEYIDEIPKNGYNSLLSMTEVSGDTYIRQNYV